MGLALAISLTPLVPTASAAGSQYWYLTNDPSGVNGAEYTMHKNSGSGSSDVHITALDWIANGAAATDTNFGTQTWTLTITYTTGSYGFSVILGYIDPTTGEFTGADGGTAIIGAGSPENVQLVVYSDFIVPAGCYLALEFFDYMFEGVTTIDVTSSPNSPTYLTYPSSSPDYPVPELSTLILMSSGLVAGTAILVYGNKKRR